MECKRCEAKQLRKEKDLHIVGHFLSYIGIAMLASIFMTPNIVVKAYPLAMILALTISFLMLIVGILFEHNNWKVIK